MNIFSRRATFFKLGAVLVLPLCFALLPVSCTKANEEPAASQPLLPLILAQPSEVTVRSPERATFTVEAEGENLVYQWKRKGIEIPGATYPTYQTPPTSHRDDGTEFTVEISNDYGSVESEAVYLQVEESLLPVIALQPVDTQASLLKRAFFKVGATGRGDMAFQWKKNGRKIPGAHANSYRTLPVSLDDNGDVYTVAIRNEYGTVESDPATLTVSSCCGTVPDIKRFDVNDTYIRQGQTCKLMWNVDGTDYVSIDNGIGVVSEHGYMYVNPRRTTTYTLRAKNGFDSQYASVTVRVQ